MGKSINRNASVSNPVLKPATRDPRTAHPRDQVQDANDPYLPTASLLDDTVCSGCGLVWYHGRWNRDDSRQRTLIAAGTPHQVVCPACRIAEGQDPQGIVTLAGDYWVRHEEEILNLIRNEASRGAEVNPLERIVKIHRENGSLIIETTTEKLAQRIGRSVHHAHKGEVDFRWSDGNHLVRVYWNRCLTGNAE